MTNIKITELQSDNQINNLEELSDDESVKIRGGLNQDILRVLNQQAEEDERRRQQRLLDEFSGSGAPDKY
ncbi:MULTISPECIES: hypothetical protein [Nostocales]|uniref:Uncharacterized protein n=3 Tax=Nostocales TaxID=1161 RepID=A0A0C1RAB3_9CYAN